MKSYYTQFAEEKLPPAVTLTDALAFFAREKPLENKHAIDLGSGNGIDTLELLGRGWQVFAIDQTEEAFSYLQKEIAPTLRESLTTLCSPFEALSTLPESTLVNATYSLPFCHPDKFDYLWQLITTCLLPGGRFAGQFFGVDDTWSTRADVTCHRLDEVKALFSDFTIEFFKEVNRPGKTLTGREKHWHVFHVVARKK